MPREIFFNEASDDWAYDRPTHGRQYNIGHSVLLIVRVPHISNHPNSHGATGRRETAESSEQDDGGIIRGQCARYLPEIDQAQ